MKSYNNYKTEILKDSRSSKLTFELDCRNYYVYRITDLETGKHYYGSRVTKLNPKDDLGIKYFSSSSNMSFISNQEKYPERFKYKILRTSDSPGDNILFESYLHSYFQVSGSPWFLNKTNQTPWGWTNTGNNDIFLKIKKTMSKIDPDTGLTGYQKLVKIRDKIMSQIDPDTGLTGYQESSKKAAETMKQVDLDTGLTGYQKSEIKRRETLSKVDPETGLTGYQESSKKAAETMSNVDHNTGSSIYNNSSIKTKEKRLIIDKETNMNCYQQSAKKGADTMSKIDLDTGLTGYQKRSSKISGKNSCNFEGSYIIGNKIYITSGDAEIDTGISSSSIRKWCKHNNNKIINIHTYNKSNFIKLLGTATEIVGKSFKEIGFSFKRII